MGANQNITERERERERESFLTSDFFFLDLQDFRTYNLWKQRHHMYKTHHDFCLPPVATHLMVLGHTSIQSCGRLDL